jgi:hypothetical protein
MNNTLRVCGAAVVISAAFACATAGGSSPTTATASRVNPDSISLAEIDATQNLRNAYDVVQRLRPTWITKARSGGFSMSGTQINAPSSGGSTALGGNSTGGGRIMVYLDDARMGTLSALSDIPISSIASIRFMDPATATALLPGLSTDVIAGAIVVHSRIR